jgi:oxygen-independent coproporphyrinogen-3 oxidase
MLDTGTMPIARDFGRPMMGPEIVTALAGVTAELLARHDRPAPRYTSYPPVPAWRQGFGPPDYVEALTEAASTPAAPISVYVHVPFCALRCLYCGCNVRITRRGDLLDRYLDDLEREIALVTGVLGGGRRVSQLHIGGGTPNYLSDEQLRRLREMLDRAFRLDQDADTAIEADPRHSSPRQLATIRALGIRRLSLGVQDLDPRVQQAIGRIQPEALVRETIDAARAAGFEGINVDLIYGLPGQAVGGFTRTCEAVINWRPDRIACFGYAHVPLLRRHQRALERHGIPQGAERFALNRAAIAAFTGAGYTWVGLDHFALADDPLARAMRERRLHRNFNGYTTMPAAHLVAFGMSGIGEVAGRLVQSHPQLEPWSRAVNRGELPTARGHRLTEDDRRRRDAILRLMCDLELPLALADQGLGPELERLGRYADEGLVEVWEGKVAVTPVGRIFLRTLCTVFDAYYADGPSGRPMSRAV